MEQHGRFSPARLVAWAQWFGLGRLVAAALSVAVVLGGGWWLVKPPPVGVEASMPRAVSGAGRSPTGSEAPASTPGAAPGASTLPVAAPASLAVSVLVVHVAGAVTRPGVYHLASGERVVDALAAAGGATNQGNPDALNLAARLSDGQRIYVPEAGEVVSLGADLSPATTPVEPIDLNTATVAQLDALPGVGPSTAAAIVAYRTAHGAFTTVAELGEVRGIGPAKLDALRPLVRV